MAATSKASISRQFLGTSMTGYEEGMPISVRNRTGGYSQATREIVFYSLGSGISQSGVDSGLHHHYLLACLCYFEPAHSLYLST